MDNKKGVKILIISLLFLVGAAYFVFGDLNYGGSSVAISRVNSTDINNVNTDPTAIYSPTTVAKNGTTVTYNFTIAHTYSSTTGENVSNILIQLPNGIFWNYWQTNGSNFSLYRFSVNQSDSTQGWNHTVGAWNFGIADNDTLNWSVLEDQNGLNSSLTSINVWLNATANASVVSDEINAAWNITLVYTDGSINVTKLNTTIDSLIPRFGAAQINGTISNVTFYDLNITDGNHTWSLGYINESYRLDSLSDWNVSVVINDTNLNTTVVYLYIGNETENATELASTQRIVMSLTGGTSTPYLFTGIIPKENLEDGNRTNFFFVANDTLNHKTYGNHSTAYATPQVFIINSSSNVLKFGTMNITDGTNTRDEFAMRNKSFVKATDLTIRLELRGAERNESNATTSATPLRLYYNASEPANETHAYIDMTNETAIGFSTTGMIVYNVTFASGIWNDSTTVHLYAVANDSKNYKTYLIQHNFTVDGTAPTTTIASSASSVTSGTSVTLTCTATETNTVTSYTFRYSIGSSESVITQSTNTYAFSPTTTGTYTIDCKATDNSENAGAYGTSSTFSVTSSSTGDTVSAGGTSSGATTTVKKGEEKDIGELATETEEGEVEVSKSVLAYEGSTTTFTISSGTSHSLVVDDIDLVNKKITVTLSSDPVTIEISMGESEMVDLDGDGVYDVEVKLNDLDLVLGRADITITDVVSRAEEAGEEPPKVEEEEEVVVEPEEVSLTGLWVVVAIVIIGLVVWWLMKKKK